MRVIEFNISAEAFVESKLPHAEFIRGMNEELMGARKGWESVGLAVGDVADEAFSPVHTAMSYAPDSISEYPFIDRLLILIQNSNPAATLYRHSERADMQTRALLRHWFIGNLINRDKCPGLNSIRLFKEEGEEFIEKVTLYSIESLLREYIVNGWMYDRRGDGLFSVVPVQELKKLLIGELASRFTGLSQNYGSYDSLYYGVLSMVRIPFCKDLWDALTGSLQYEYSADALRVICALMLEVGLDDVLASVFEASLNRGVNESSEIGRRFSVGNPFHRAKGDSVSMEIEASVGELVDPDVAAEVLKTLILLKRL